MQILNYSPINKGCLKAKFNVLINDWGLTIRECSLFEKDGKKWIGLPSRQYDKDGKIKNLDYVVFDKERRIRFDKACLEKINSGQ